MFVTCPTFIGLIWATLIAATAEALNSVGQEEVAAPESQSTVARVGAALTGALIADALAIGSHGTYDFEKIHTTYAGSVSPSDLQTAFHSFRALDSAKAFGDQTECGDELIHALKTVSLRGFQLDSFAESWRDWVESYEGVQRPAIQEAWKNWASGASVQAAGSHYIDLGGAVRAPAVLLLLQGADDKMIVAAAREAVLLSHENPKALQACEFLIRTAVRLLRSETQVTSLAQRRDVIIAALRASADEAGKQFHAIVDDALSEAQRRDAFTAAGAGPADGFAATRDDVEVIGRMTASGDDLGQEVQSDKTSFAVPAVVWLVVAYGSFMDAIMANALLGGESGTRAIFVGLLAAAQDGPGAVPSRWIEQVAARPPLLSKVPSFLSPLRLCAAPGECFGQRAWAGEISMHRVTVAAAVASVAPRGVHPRYRIYVRINGADFLKADSDAKPGDWDDEEDGEWEPKNGDRLSCLARYFQFTGVSGRHAPFSLWPAEAMCSLSPESPIAYESFDLVMPEPLTHLIGGMVLGSADRIVKLPRLMVTSDAEAPEWSRHCSHIGTVKLPEGTWEVDRGTDL